MRVRYIVREKVQFSIFFLLLLSHISAGQFLSQFFKHLPSTSNNTTQQSTPSLGNTLMNSTEELASLLGNSSTSDKSTRQLRLPDGDTSELSTESVTPSSNESTLMNSNFSNESDTNGLNDNEDNSATQEKENETNLFDLPDTFKSFNVGSDINATILPPTNSIPDTVLTLSPTNASQSNVTDQIAQTIGMKNLLNDSTILTNMLNQMGLDDVHLSPLSSDLPELYKMNISEMHPSSFLNFTNANMSLENQNATTIPEESEDASTGMDWNTTNGLSLNNAITGADMTATNNTSSSVTDTGLSAITGLSENSATKLSQNSTTIANSSQAVPTTPNSGLDLMEDEFGKIIYVAVYFRHGACTLPAPIFIHPNNVSFAWLSGFGQLTNEGKSDSYKFGQWLQQRYITLLGSGYNRSLITVESGGTDVTLSTAECVAAGLFPPFGNDVWNNDLKWQPVPIYSLPPQTDTVILMQEPCKVYKIEKDNFNDSPAATDIYEQYDDVFTKLSESMHYNFTSDNILLDLNKAWLLYQDLQSLETEGLPLPSWTKHFYPEPLRTMSKTYLDKAICTDTMKKFKAGPFIKVLTENMSRKINSTTNSSIIFPEAVHLYSGSAEGIEFIRTALNIEYDPSIPPYSSALLFELRLRNFTYVLTISYKNGTSDDLKVVEISNCVQPCAFDDFVANLNQFIPDDWNDECDVISLTELSYSIPLLIAGIVVLLLLIFLIVLLVIKCYKCVRKNSVNIKYQ